MPMRQGRSKSLWLLHLLMEGNSPSSPSERVKITPVRSVVQTALRKNRDGKSVKDGDFLASQSSAEFYRCPKAH